MARSSFVYVAFIRTTPEQLWAALTTPDFIKKYWFGMNLETDWKVGSPWKLIFPDGRVADTGEILESIEKSRYRASRKLLEHVGETIRAGSSAT